MMRIEIPAPQWALVVAALLFCIGLYVGWKAGAFWTRSNAEMEHQAQQKEISTLRDQHRQEREAIQQRNQADYNRLWAELLAVKKGASPSLAMPASRPSVAATVTANDGEETRTPIGPVPALTPAKVQQRGMPRGQGIPQIDRDDDLDR